MRIIGISTSPRKDANTERFVNEALKGAVSAASRLEYSIEKEIISLAGKRIEPCRHCDECVRKGTYCVVSDDWASLIQKLIDPIPDGLIFGSPVYFFNQNSLGRAFMERCTSLLKKEWYPDFPFDPPDFSCVAAGAVAVGNSRNGGVEHTLSTIIHWLLTMGFVTVSSFYIGGAGWTKGNIAHNAICEDKTGLESAQQVGEKLLELRYC